MTECKKLIISAAAALVLSACGTTVPLNDVPVIDKQVKNLDDVPRPCCVNPNGPQRDALDDPSGILAKRSIYLDHDEYTVKEEFRPMLDAHARYLLANNKRVITLVGHTDERGSSEYSLALGMKRADTVQRMLQLLGVPAAKMESISYGKEKPKALGSDEAAWAENRRVDLEYR